ncbi:MAG: hypothetical protein U1E93_12065 [Alphaproteobacteria bacterium]
MKTRNTARNRRIYADYLSGEKPQRLAELHGLNVATVKHIIGAEKLKHAVSIEGYYRRRRENILQQS